MEVHDPHRVEGEHHEKKPVIKKVKDKVKKIKDKISKKHGHDHDDEHGHNNYGHSEEGEGYEHDDDDVEMETDPEVHGAPIYESATRRDVAGGRDENIGHGKMSFAEARAATAVKDPWMPKKPNAMSDESRLSYPSARDADRSGNLMTGIFPAEQSHPSFQSPPVYGSANPRNLASTRDVNIGHGTTSMGEVTAPTAVEDPGMRKKSTASDERKSLYPSPYIGGDKIGTLRAIYERVGEHPAAANTVTGGASTTTTAQSHPSYGSPTADRSGNLMTGIFPEAANEQSHPSFQSPTAYESANPRNLASIRDENIGHGKMSLGEVMASAAVEDPGMPKKSVGRDETRLLNPSPSESKGGDKVGALGAISERVGEDPAAPKSMTGGTPTTRTSQNHPSYGSPTGKDEVGESPLLPSFQAMTVSDEPEDRQYTTETAPQFSRNKAHQDRPGEQMNTTETSPTGTQDQFSHYKAHEDRPREQKSSTYTDKIASTATSAKDAAVSAAMSAYEKASGVGAAIMGKGTAEAEKHDPKSRETDQPWQPASDKVTRDGTPITGTETTPTGTPDQFSHNKAHQDEPEEQKSSTYTGKIASTATTAKDAAVSAAISAYGKVSGAGSAIMGKGTAEAEKHDPKSRETEQPWQPASDKVTRDGTPIMGTETTPTGTPDQFSHNKAHHDVPEEQKSSTYTGKIASTATTAKDAAVSAAISAYEKVSGAGSAIMGKGTAEAEKYDTKSRETDQPLQPVLDKLTGARTPIKGRGTAEAEKYEMKYGQTGQPGQPVPDKGVSMKEYMAGKLRPGDEDRALSEVITDTIHQKKQDEEMNTSAGRAREGAGKDGGGKGMVEKIKGAVTSWIGAGAHPSETPDTEIK